MAVTIDGSQGLDTDNTELTLEVSGSEKARIDSSGNVGIGTSSPSAKLHIQDSNYSPTNSGGLSTGLRFSGGTTGINTYTNGLSFSYGSGSSAISGVQTGSDSDRMGVSFFTHPSSTGIDNAVEQMRIHHDGYLINPNGITLGTGSASSFAAANTLDDYEEGTWTPSFNGFSITGTVNVTGTYTKVGNLVYINAYIDARSGTIAATAGSSYLSGLPFSSSGASSGTWVNRETIADDGGFMVFSTNVYITNGWSAVAHRFFLSTVYYTTA